jgi:formylglycine-generating enzyme required for sulfatase activity
VRGARVPTLAVVAIVGVSAAASAAYVAASHRLPVEHRADAGVAATNGCPGRPREPTPGLFDDEVCIPGGTFLMGSPEGEGDYDEHPRHAVTVAPFYVDRYEVTVARYRRCVAMGACDPAGTGTEGPYDAAGNYDARGTHYRPSSRCTYRDRPSAEDAQPINCISHAQAVRVCLFEGKRLLSEAEWERVARGLGERPRTYPWGDAPPDCNRAAFGYGAGCGLAEPAPVGTARAGATPEGVFDLAGNVAEWTQDWYSDVYYGHAPASNPPGATLGEAREHGGDPQICRDGCRVTRGGAWNTVATRVSLLRGAHRSADAVNRRAVHLGVRCARTP